MAALHWRFNQRRLHKPSTGIIGRRLRLLLAYGLPFFSRVAQPVAADKPLIARVIFSSNSDLTRILILSCVGSYASGGLYTRSPAPHAKFSSNSIYRRGGRVSREEGQALVGNRTTAYGMPRPRGYSTIRRDAMQGYCPSSRIWTRLAHSL
ncbi:hypothetical protein F5Y14DRAFT_91824 [Nemania sp. NC0429]|nr:hypothetical protein F5Y14DRAFT_91824 [Nemania sp. NC0429]